MAREDPAAFMLLWRHAAREPQFAAYALELRAMSVAAVRELMAISSDDAAFDHWAAEVVIGWLVESVLTWLEVGDPAATTTWSAGPVRRSGGCVPVGSTRRCPFSP